MVVDKMADPDHEACQDTVIDRAARDKSTGAFC